MSSTNKSKMSSVATAGLLGIIGAIGFGNSAHATDIITKQSPSSLVGAMHARAEITDDVPAYEFALGTKLGPNASLDQFSDWLRMYQFEDRSIIALKGSADIFGIPVLGTVYGQNSSVQSKPDGFGAEIVVGPFAKESIVPDGVGLTLGYQNSDTADVVGAGFQLHPSPDTVFKFRADTVTSKIPTLDDYSQVYLGVLHSFSPKDYAGAAIRLTDSTDIGNTFNAGYLHYGDDIGFRILSSYTDAKTDKGFVELLVAQNPTLGKAALHTLLNANILDTGNLSPQFIHSGTGVVDDVRLYDRSTRGFSASAKVGFDEKNDSNPYAAEVAYTIPLGETRLSTSIFGLGDLSNSDSTKLGIKAGIDLPTPLENLIDTGMLRFELGVSEQFKTDNTDMFGAINLRCQF